MIDKPLTPDEFVTLVVTSVKEQLIQDQRCFNDAHDKLALELDECRYYAKSDALLDIRHEEDGSWSVSIRAMPGHVGCAITLEGAYAEAHDAALAWIGAHRIDVEALARALGTERVRKYVMEAWVGEGVSQPGYATPAEMAAAIAREYAVIKADTAALDVERLAKALARRTDHTDAWVLLPKQMQDLWRKDAAAIAREYEASEKEWCLHCGSDTCEHATQHNTAYGKAAQ
jgi:predicted RNase H-like HicB family nuclease